MQFSHFKCNTTCQGPTIGKPSFSFVTATTKASNMCWQTKVRKHVLANSNGPGQVGLGHCCLPTHDFQNRPIPPYGAFLTKNCWYFSYYSTKTYVVVLIRRISVRCFYEYSRFHGEIRKMLLIPSYLELCRPFATYKVKSRNHDETALVCKLISVSAVQIWWTKMHQKSLLR